MAPALLPGAGVLAGSVTARDEADAGRAAAIVAALGAVDVGQGAVVVQGLCLGVEALPGRMRFWRRGGDHHAAPRSGTRQGRLLQGRETWAGPAD